MPGHASADAGSSTQPPSGTPPVACTERPAESLQRLQEELERQRAETQRYAELYRQEKMARERAEAERQRPEEEQALRQSHRKLSAALESITDCYFAVDREWRLIEMNERAAAYVNARREALLGRNLWEAFPQLVNTTLWQQMHKAASEQVPVHFETESKVVAGRFAEIHAYPSHEGVSVYFRDITDRKRAEDAVRSSEQRLRLAIAASHAMVYEIDLRHDQVNTVEGLYELLGYQPDELAFSQWWFQQIHPEDVISLEWLMSLVASDDTYSQEYRIRHKEGHYLHVLDKGKVVRDGAGHPVRVVGSVIDITARKQAEEAIQQQQRLIDAIFDNILAHVAYLDRNFNFVRVNATYAQGCGHRIEELIGRNHFDLFPNAENQAIFERVRDTDQPYVARATPFIYADQPERGVSYWDWWLHPIRGLDGQTEGLVLSLVDVTPIEQGRREVERLNGELQRVNAAKDHFMAVLSHELRTPLAPVLTMAQMMERDDTVPPNLHDVFSMIRRNVELEARLIDDLLDLNRISRGKLQLHLQAVDVHASIRQVMEICESDRQAKRQQLKLDLKARQHVVQADPARLQQMIWNLLGNAIKFTPVGGRITLRTGNTAENQIAIRVEDTGMGIEPETLPRLFNAFEQEGKATTRRFGGLGLGLSITKSLAELHGGTVAAHSEGRNRGARFTLCLPISSGEQSDDSRAGNQAAKGKLCCHILLVEDHADTAKVMAQLLASFGCSVRVADSVASALRAAEAEQFDLLICDIGLPDGSGHDLMRQLSAQHGLKGIALSGYGMEESIRKSQQAGFAAHLIKPVDIQRLEETIRQMLMK